MGRKIDCPKCGRDGVDHKAKGMCFNCYRKKHYNSRRQKCGGCKKIKSTNYRNGSVLVCQSCYNRPEEECGTCGEIGPIASKKGGVVCKKCYSQRYVRKKALCNSCGRIRPVYKRCDDNSVLCISCNVMRLYNSNEQFRISHLVRGRLRKAFKLYTAGKIMASAEYGIDYEKIFNHIGKCPGDKSQYHVDHIFPLVAFDLTDPNQVAAAFAPENHQWLRAKDNLSKNDRFNMKEFQKYLERFLGGKI